MSKLQSFYPLQKTSIFLSDKGPPPSLADSFPKGGGVTPPPSVTDTFFRLLT